MMENRSNIAIIFVFLWRTTLSRSIWIPPARTRICSGHVSTYLSQRGLVGVFLLTFLGMVHPQRGGPDAFEVLFNVVDVESNGENVEIRVGSCVLVKFD